jgi:hypothetical protein
MKRTTNRPAAVAVELALCLPLLCFIMVALAELCLVGIAASNLQNTTSSASILCSQGKDNCTAGAIRTTCNVPNDWTIKVDTNATNRKDAYGQTIYTATITVSAPYQWMIPGVSGLVSSDPSNLPDTLTRTATTPIINSPPE